MGRLRENLQGEKVYLDANIFIYTLEAHPLWVPLLTDLFSGLYRHEFAASTSNLTLSECLVMPFKKRDPNLIKTYREALQPSEFLRVAPIDTHTLITAAHLRAQFGQKLPDAIHTATAQIEACTVILTNDIGFKRIAGLKVFILSEWLDSAI
jgi:predicted nucleic acid-binding protein